MKVVAGVAATATVVTLAVLADGYDAQEVPRLESSVWVTRDSGQYARVNTDLAEIDTVRSADDPDAVVQAGADSLVLTQGLRRAWTLDSAAPVDLVESSGGAASPGDGDADADAAADTAADDGEGAAAPADDAPGSEGGDPTPPGTRSVTSSGRVIGYLTDTGEAYVATLPDSRTAGAAAASEPLRIQPAEPEGQQDADAGDSEGEPAEPETYVVSAMAVSAEGRVALYSAEEEAVRVFDAASGAFVGGEARIDDAPAADADLAMAIVGDGWALSEASESRVWLSSRTAPLDTGLPAGARLQASTLTAGDIHLAFDGGLAAIDPSTGSVDTVVEASGIPAVPVPVGDVVHAAWLTPSGGSLWSSEDDELVSLQVDGDELDQVETVTPVLQSNGDRVVLNETASGMLWTVPDGRLIPLSQWTADDDDEQQAGQVDVEDVAEQEPPVAVADSFGVRTGQLVRLPVLLNDHDPNKRDVLTISPESVTPLSDPGFGELQLVAQNQEAVVRVRAGVGATATFSYSVTDGQAVSAPVAVTLTVVGDDVDTAPAWCGVEGCVQEWPSPSLAPGGTATIPVLPGWVDPEGDLFVLSDARSADVTAPLTVVATADGEVALRHTDPNAPGDTVPVIVTVTDSRGVSTERELLVTVRADPPIEAKPVAVVGGVGETVSVPIARHVTGGSGALRLVDAVETSSSTGGGLQVVPNAASGEVALTAAAAGEFQVTYTVADPESGAEQSAIIRLTAVAGTPALTMSPLAAFVRPNEDTTVDVLGAVQNTAGRVLLVAGAATDDPGLSVDAVGQSRVRISGSTEDGRPGLVGEAAITVADGSGAEVQGSLTVFLVEASSGISPIAVPDSVTVRAGNQLDIPVLANDVSPRGERLLLHPDVEGSGAEGELVFAGASTLRYLAPPEPGVYAVRYSIYLENSPSRIDTAYVTVTVTAAGANRDPQPPTLTARVLSGQTVSIPVPASGADPDGDRVVLADVSQPDTGAGAASISAEGDAILYTAPADGVAGGQLGFAYTVRDPDGAEGTGRVRIGVLARELTDTAPIAYSDYARVQAGSESPLRVLPLRNDRDPAQGQLELLSLVPNAPGGEGNPEFDRLAALVDPATSLEDGEVVLRGGDVLGAHSYVYTVRSTESSSTSQGLVVVNVTDTPAPDHPIVSDTIVTARDRSELEKGLDVVAGKVDWSSGDASTLKLSLWNGTGSSSPASDYTVDGWRIAGPAPEAGALIPFTLTGEDSSGREVTAHGFLRIPAFDDMRLQLRAELDPVTVGEDEAVDFDLGDLLDLDSSDRVEVRGDSAFAVQRAAATCAPASGLSVRYTAGREAPWSDSCTVAVRIDGQKRWSALAVPVSIEPKDPQAILESVSRTVAPGATETLDLLESMTTWEGGREGDVARLDFRAAYSGSSFVVTPAGRTVTFEARADARPGTRETVQVSVSAFGGLTAAVTLVVGVAPVDAPRGATFRAQCTVTSGSCTIPVVGLAGEYDPFDGRTGAGLKLAGVGAGGGPGCTVARVAAAGDTSVVASWPAGPKPEGGECVVPFTVRDAQGRSGEGRLTIDVQGFPRAPTSVSATSYTGSSVTLAVSLGEAAQAHPAISGVAIYENGGRVAADCGPGGPGIHSCTVGGLQNGAEHTYTARAVNSVGESLDTTAHTTNAYQAPVISSVTVEQAPYAQHAPSISAGQVVVTIEGSADTRSYRIDGTGIGADRAYEGGRSRYVFDGVPVGGLTVSVVPSSQFSPPRTLGGTNQGATGTASTTVAGKPYFSGELRVEAVTDNGTIAAESRPVVNSNFAAGASTIRYYLTSGFNNPVTCAVDSSSRLTMPGGADRESGEPTFSGLEAYRPYTITACGTNGHGVTDRIAGSAFTGVSVGTPGGGGTYTIGTAFRTGGAGEYIYDSVTMPTITPEDSSQYVLWRINGTTQRETPTARNFSFDAAPQIEVASCFDRRGWGGTRTVCSDWRQVTSDSERTTIARIVLPTGSACLPPGTASADQIVVSGGYRSSANPLATTNAEGTGGSYSVTWSNQFQNPPASAFTICKPEPTPDPTPPTDPVPPPVTPPAPPAP